MIEELKRCPFCGAKAIIKTQKCDYGISGTIIRCTKCSARLYTLDKQAVAIGNCIKNIPVENHRMLAIKAWNKRVEEERK